MMTVPETVTFEQAIELTQQLLLDMEAGELADTDLVTTLSSLVGSENGARGFFVTYLTDDRALVDQPSEAVLQGLRSSPAIVSELLVKNLAMSSTMAITHRRNQNEELAQSSDRVQTRTSQLIRLLQLSEVTEKLQKLHESAATGEGAYQTFLDRWGYDTEQRQVICQVTNGALIEL